MTVCKKGLRLIFFVIAIVCIQRAAYGGDGPSGTGASLGSFETVPISNVTLITPNGTNVAHTTPTTVTFSPAEAALHQAVQGLIIGYGRHLVLGAISAPTYVGRIISLAWPKTIWVAPGEEVSE